MNTKEISEIRRRFKYEKGCITKIYGCYVGSDKQIISYVDTSFLETEQEEQKMYLNLLKKTLSGTLDRNLIDIEFSTAQVADSDEHRLLEALRQSSLDDGEAREELYRKIINSVNFDDLNYLILLASDIYDVPGKATDGEEMEDASETVFRYFVCSIIPVKDPAWELRYFSDEKLFHSSSSGYVAMVPEAGFMFPAFDDRQTNIYNALFYSRDTSEIHQELIDALFCIEKKTMSATEQKDTFDAVLSEALDSDCSFDVVQSVHEMVRTLIEEHKESGDTEPLDLTVNDMGGILRSSGVSEEKVEAFSEKCREQYGSDTTLKPKNIIETKKYEVKTPDVKISVSAENSYLIETRIIDGKKYILIPAEFGIEVNGINVVIPDEDEK